jgi:excisionase family DNA binding protein
MGTHPAQLERLLTIAEVSDYLGVPVGTLYQWRHKQTGPKGIRVGRHVRYRPREVGGVARLAGQEGRATRRPAATTVVGGR